MLTQPGIVMMSAVRGQTQIPCVKCGAAVYSLQPYEVVYPRNSFGRAMGQTNKVSGDCKSCGHTYEFPVTRTA